MTAEIGQPDKDLRIPHADKSVLVLAENVKKHAIEVGIPANVFEPKEQKVFAVRDCDFKEVIPVLLVSILGSRASYMQELAEGIETKGKRAKSYREIRKEARNQERGIIS